METEKPLQPVRIGFYVFFPAGGIGRYTNELLGMMSSFPGVSVEAMCTPDFQWKNTEAYHSWTGLRSISHDVPALRRFRFLQGQFINPARGIRRAVEAGLDILHFSNINHLSFPYWRRQLESSGLKMAISVHDVQRQKKIFSRSWEERQLKACYRYADALFVHSAYQANQLIDFAGADPDRIHIVPHGPYPHGLVRTSREEVRRRLALPIGEQVALFFGQIRDDKNLGRLVEALQLSTSKPHLLVAGPEGARLHRSADYYRQLAREIGVEDRVTFLTRFIPDDEVGDLFAASDWVALPYRGDFSSQSGVLNVAAHYERPVLVSEAPVLRETIELCDIGVIASGDSSKAIAEGIDRMSSRVNGGYVHEFAQYRQRFSWYENARRTVKAYRSLLT